MAIIQRISDFSLCRKVLELICRQYACNFADINVSFDESCKMPCFENGMICLPEDIKLSKSFFSVIALYLANIQTICGKSIPDGDRSYINGFIFDLVNDFIMERGHSPVREDSQIVMRLDQDAVSWILIKNIVCPYASKRLKNLRMIASHSGHLDACKFVTEKELPDHKLSEDNFPFLFINLDVERKSIRSAFLFYEATKAHCDDAAGVIRSIFSDRILRDKMVGFISMAYPDHEDFANFFAVLSLLCDCQEMEDLALMPPHEQGEMSPKTAQLGMTNWWFLGLIEKLLEPSRAPDWTPHFMWQPFLDDLHSRVEDERRKRGLDEVPLEVLLRVQGDEFSVDGRKTLQSLLSSDRVW